jgi:hypothetical protein
VVREVRLRRAPQPVATMPTQVVHSEQAVQY